MGNRGKPTLVLDLDETLVHSSFQKLEQWDFDVVLDLEGRSYTVYVLVRPKAHQFLLQVSQIYEVVIFTASKKEYANLVIDKLDTKGVVSQRLYREHCTLISGGYAKDLARLGRKLKRTVIVDFQPNNALEITSWFGDREDTALESLLPLLEALAKEQDMTLVLPELNRRHRQQLDEVAKTGPDADLPPIAKTPPASPPSHRGYYNSPHAGQTKYSFSDVA